MDYLIDTNILLRRIERQHPQYRETRDAINRLHARGDRLCVVPQNFIEFWTVCTRPMARNGIGMTPSQADRMLSRLEAALTLLPETEQIHYEWRRLVVLHGVSGKKAYDARLVAAMHIHKLKSILMFNVDDFRRYPDIEAVQPLDTA